MKIFIDTNVFMEFFERRDRYYAVGKILDAIEDGVLEAVISTGGIYTMTYLLTLGLKRNNIHKPQQTEKLRNALREVTNLCHVVEISHRNIIQAIDNEDFSDIEDSYQYQCALQNECKVLVTINLRDYKHADRTSIEILSPEEFTEKYLNF